MFDFTVCMLSNPAPPPFAVSKYASVTLPLKPVLCDKGCMLKRDWNAKFPWAPDPSVTRVLIRSPLPETCKSLVQCTWDQVSPGQTWPPQKNPPHSEPCGNLISERGKCVNNRLSFLKVMPIQERLLFLLLAQQWKKGLVSVALYQPIYKGRFRWRTHQIFHCSIWHGGHDTVTLGVLS